MAKRGTAARPILERMEAALEREAPKLAEAMAGAPDTEVLELALDGLTRAMALVARVAASAQARCGQCQEAPEAGEERGELCEACACDGASLDEAGEAFVLVRALQREYMRRRRVRMH